MMTPDAETNEVISFGPFSLVASERRLTRNGVPVEITGRAYDILVVLLSRPNEVVSKSDLTQVWPTVAPKSPVSIYCRPYLTCCTSGSLMFPWVAPWKWVRRSANLAGSDRLCTPPSPQANVGVS